MPSFDVKLLKERITIHIPHPKSFLHIIFYSTVIFFWFFFLINILHIFILSVTWLFLGICVIFVYLWHLGGSEVVNVSNESLTIERKFFIIVFRKKSLAIDKIKVIENTQSLGYDDLDSSARRMDFLKLSVGSISVKYGNNSIRFANELNPNEAVSILHELSKLDFIREKVKINDLSVKDELNSKKKRKSLLPDQFEEF